MSVVRGEAGTRTEGLLGTILETSLIIITIITI